MKTETEEKAVSEVKSPTPDAETVEAAKQILTDVLTKAVDAIKEETSSLSSNVEIEDVRECKENEKRVDYIVKFIDEATSKPSYIGENTTIVRDPFKALGFDTAKEAKDFIESFANKSFILDHTKVYMRKIECSLYEMEFGTSCS